MLEITKTDLEEAQKAIASVIHKCEQAQASLSQRQPPPAAQLTLLSRRLKALRLAMALITRELEAYHP